MNKEKWIKCYTTGKFATSDEDVITFIANVLYTDETQSDRVYEIFASGYCYYFAMMLKAAFNRGDICWHRNHGHIVWVDESGIAYDIGGVFYDYEDGDLLPVETSLADMIVDFKHNGETYSTGSKKFKDWTEHYHMTEIYAISDIYRNIPKGEVDDNKTVADNALDYWCKNIHVLSYYYAEKKHQKNMKGE